MSGAVRTQRRGFSAFLGNRAGRLENKFFSKEFFMDITKKRASAAGAAKMVGDMIITPDNVSEDIVRHFHAKYGISGDVLDPFFGEGSFYWQFAYILKYAGEKDRYFGHDIIDGYDFFKNESRYSWIISNPPYSSFTRVLQHSMELADNIVYLIPINKITSSMGRVRRILEWGGIPEIRIYEPKECGFRFGFALGAVYLKRGYAGATCWSLGLEKGSK
jgi:hypothetical protein